MSDVNDESDILRSVLIEEAESRVGDHPPLEELIAYHQKRLAGEAEERLRDHLAACRTCAEQLLELRPLMRPDEAPAADVADLEIEAAWSRFQTLAAAAEAPPSRLAPPRWAQAMAASLVVAVLGIGGWALQLRQTNQSLRRQLGAVSQPTVNMPVVYFDEATRSPRAGPYRLETSGSTDRFVLFFSVADSTPADEYEVRFLDLGGQEVLRQGGLMMSELGSLRLGLPRALLPAADYRVLLRGRRAGKWWEVEEYRLTVADR